MQWYSDRRKFRSQTSDNMDRWKAEMGRVREKRRVEERRSEKRKSQKKEDADVRKGRKAAKHCVFPMICGSWARKVGSLKRRVRSHLARCDERWKSARRCGAKRISKSKCTKHTRVGPLLEVEISKKCTPLWREAHFEVKMYKTHHVRTTFGRSELISRGRHRVLCTFSKVSKTWGFCSIAKNDGRTCKDAFSVAGTVQETFPAELFGGDFLRGVAFWSIRSSGLLRWFRVTGTALRMTWHHFFVAGAIV